MIHSQLLVRGGPGRRQFLMSMLSFIGYIFVDSRRQAVGKFAEDVFV